MKEASGKYKYPHDYSGGYVEQQYLPDGLKDPHSYGGWVEQQYLPDSLKDRVYYKPSDHGYEVKVKEIEKRKRGK